MQMEQLTVRGTTRHLDPTSFLANLFSGTREYVHIDLGGEGYGAVTVHGLLTFTFNVHGAIDFNYVSVPQTDLPMLQTLAIFLRSLSRQSPCIACTCLKVPFSRLYSVEPGLSILPPLLHQQFTIAADPPLSV